MSENISENLESEIRTAKVLLSNLAKVDTVFDVFHELKKTPESFKCLIMLMKIMLTIPVSTASNERIFSTLKRVKNYTRTTTGDERLSNLILMATEQTFVKSLDLSSLIDKFAGMCNRRYPLI